MAGAISTQWNAGTHRPDSGTMWPACQHHGAPWESQHSTESKLDSFYQINRKSKHILYFVNIIYATLSLRGNNIVLLLL